MIQFYFLGGGYHERIQFSIAICACFEQVIILCTLGV